jgi:uncharacterized protein (TIGR02118 family)
VIKLSVMYPKSEDTTFDVDYYKTTHMEIVDRTMKPVKWEIDAGVDGPYVAVGRLFFDSMETMGASFADAAESQADVANFTNAQAVIQISEVVA